MGGTGILNVGGEAPLVGLVADEERYISAGIEKAFSIRAAKPSPCTVYGRPSSSFSSSNDSILWMLSISSRSSSSIDISSWSLLNYNVERGESEGARRGVRGAPKIYHINV